MASDIEFIEKGWADACRVLLGTEVGPIGEYSEYLQRYVEPLKLAESEISKKPVAVSSGYPEGTRFISGDEIGEYAELMRTPLDIGSIKDIDSLLDALEEKLCYSGNVVLGNSGNVSGSNRIFDSRNVYQSHEVFYSRSVAYGYVVRYSESVFGSENVGQSGFVIRGFDIYGAKRMMECLHAYHSSDCIYSANLENCQECLFCFNLRFRKRSIGNLELPKERFDSLKAKLTAEIRETLEKNKSLPTINEIIMGRGGGWDG